MKRSVSLTMIDRIDEGEWTWMLSEASPPTDRAVVIALRHMNTTCEASRSCMG